MPSGINGRLHRSTPLERLSGLPEALSLSNCLPDFLICCASAANAPSSLRTLFTSRLMTLSAARASFSTHRATFCRTERAHFAVLLPRQKYCVACGPADGTPHAWACCASGLDPPCPGRCPDRWRHRFPSPLRPFWKKRAAGRHPQKPIAGRGRCPLRTNPRTRRGAEGNGRPFPSRASVALHSVKGLSRHMLPRFAQSAIPRSP